MPRRQPPFVPQLWLFTDERIETATLMRALARLPRGSGIVFRHYGLGREERRMLFAAVSAIARRRGLMLLVAGEAAGRHPDGHHLTSHMRRSMRAGAGRGLISAAAHNAREIAAVTRLGANMIFLSPVFSTRSHPGGRTLGLWSFATLARKARCPVIALGGMTHARFRQLKPLGAYGWAAIDAFTAIRT